MLKLFNSKSRGDYCLVCALKPLVILGGIFGVSPIKSNCPHAKQPSAKAFYETSKIFMATGIIFVLFLFIVICWYGYLMATDSIRKDSLVLMQILAEIFYYSTGFIVVVTTLIDNNKVTELNAWIFIIQRHKLLDKKEMTRMRRKCIIYTCLICTSVLFFCTYAFSQESDSKFFNWATLRRPCCIISSFVQVIAIFQIVIRGLIVCSLYNSSNAILKDALIKRINIKPKSNKSLDYMNLKSEDVLEEDINLNEVIRDYQELHHVMTFNLKSFLQQIGGCLTVWFLLLLGVLIINIYVLVTAWHADKYSTLLTILEFRTIAMIVFVTYLLINVEDVGSVVSKLMQ